MTPILRGDRKLAWLKPGLNLASQVYRFAVEARNYGYDRGWLASDSLPKMVISVGNIAVCGTGKTPFVHLLATLLKPHLSLAILTRGFKSDIERLGWNRNIPSEGAVSVERYGDEPLLLFQKTGVPVWVGVDRIHSGQLAIEAGAECLLLDDGLQHRRLHRDLDIVLVDGKDPLCQKRFLPYGLLRDSLDRLSQAALLVATHIEDREHYQKVEQQLAPYTTAPLLGVRACPVETLSLPGRVGLFCGIGRPERFVQTVRDLNQEIVDTLLCMDHEVPTERGLCAFAKRCLDQGAQALVCTEKDAIKLPSTLSLPLPVMPIPIELKIVEGESHLRRLIETIVTKVTS